ncbi:hypothetical protein QUF49_09875 [Fictibacillus sp. b24]|nr:hypothetical protein [Fictibacillus sp. b24]MDM5316302.1 hypothetical protein [Fictibacillus sp. b24]
MRDSCGTSGLVRYLKVKRPNIAHHLHRKKRDLERKATASKETMVL